jgi:pyrroline-5-carboxylate reductase
MINVGFIGAGNMGSALAKATAKAGCKVYIYDKDEKKAELLASEIGAEYAENGKIAEIADYIFLAVKPNIVSIAINELKDVLKDRSTPYTVVSMAAGVSIEKLEAAFSPVMPAIIRIMPNTPVAYGKGMTLFTKNKLVSDGAAEGFTAITSHSGRLDEISEKLIDAASAVSGCGPAFVYMFIEALADGGVECGLPRDKALLYAAETLIGAAETVKASGKHPGELKDAVCSPGGSTIEGVLALEDGAFRSVSSSAVVAAYEKTLKLGK